MKKIILVLPQPTPDHGHVVKIDGKEYEVISRVWTPGKPVVLELAPYTPPPPAEE